MKAKLHPILAEKLKKTTKQYKNCTEFALLFPQYTYNIIQYEADGNNYFKLDSRHGKLPLNWGVNWQTTTPTNYPKNKKKPKGLVDVYINTYSLFGGELYAFSQSELAEVIPNIKCHFFDALNTTFYFLPEEVEKGLNQLEKWYTSTQEKTKDFLKEKRRKELEQELENLNASQ